MEYFSGMLGKKGMVFLVVKTWNDNVKLQESSSAWFCPNNNSVALVSTGIIFSLILSYEKRVESGKLIRLIPHFENSHHEENQTPVLVGLGAKMKLQR